MNFGEKFPYALLTFSQSLSKLIVGHTFSQSLSKLVIGVHLLPKFVEADCGPHLLPKFVEAGYWVHYTPIITRTPSSTSTPTPHTNYTPTIHNPTTPPIPLLLRVDSDEMWQKPAGFWLMRCWTARKGPRMGPKVHEVDSARRTNKARACSMSVCCERGRNRRWMRGSPNPAEFAPSPPKFPQTLQYFRKSHKQ